MAPHGTGTYITDGKVLGTLRKGVSVVAFPTGSVEIYVGDLRELKSRRVFAMKPKAAAVLARELAIAAMDADSMHTRNERRQKKG